MNARVDVEDDALERGWQALAYGAWVTAHIAFTTAVADTRTLEVFEGLGFAAWWLNNIEETFQARESAYRLYVERGDRHGAARVACSMGSIPVPSAP